MYYIYTLSEIQIYESLEFGYDVIKWGSLFNTNVSRHRNPQIIFVWL